MGVAATPVSVKLHGWLGMKMPRGEMKEWKRNRKGDRGVSYSKQHVLKCKLDSFFFSFFFAAR